MRETWRCESPEDASKPKDARNPKMRQTRRCDKPEQERNPKMRETRRCKKTEDARNQKMLETQRCEKLEDVRNCLAANMSGSKAMSKKMKDIEKQLFCLKAESGSINDPTRTLSKHLKTKQRSHKENHTSDSPPELNCDTCLPQTNCHRNRSQNQRTTAHLKRM